MSDMKCPFCGDEIISDVCYMFDKKTKDYINGKQIYKCNKCGLFGKKALWQELIRTRKALDVANEKLRHCVNITVEELDELKGNLLIAWNALVHFSKDPIANNALKKITALEQKDMK